MMKPMIRYRRDPADRRRAAETIDRLRLMMAAAVRDRRWLDALEAGVVMADALEAAGYVQIANSVREDLVEAESSRSMSPVMAPEGTLQRAQLYWNMAGSSVERALRELVSDKAPDIQDPNTSGQGYAPSHLETPFHDDLARTGFRYSHSTRVFHPPGRRHDYDLHHTYRRILESPELRRSTYVSLWHSTHVPSQPWRWEVSATSLSSRFAYGRRQHRKLHGSTVEELRRIIAPKRGERVAWTDE